MLKLVRSPKEGSVVCDMYNWGLVMKTRMKSRSILKVCLGLAAIILLIQNNPAVAQESDEALEEIVA